ncbi:glycoside hydrolase family 27 protein [Dyella flagellata]
MGFNNWNVTQCGDAFNEGMIRGIADKFVSLGLRDAGYTYVNIDDCWANGQRDKNGQLQPNPRRFPSGIKALADYIHQRGLKFGLYSSAGTSTCETRENGGFPGSLDHERHDAATFAAWGVDYLKYDNCNHMDIDAQQRYAAMALALRASGRSIFYSICERGENEPWAWAGKRPVDAGSWRTSNDLSDVYASMLENFKQNVGLDRYARPGHYNDPDVLEVGNGGMTDTEYRSHFSLWSIMAAPLLIGADLRTIKPEALKILLNKEVIAVDQDPLGIQGKQVRDIDGIHVIVKPLKDGSRAVAVFNENDTSREVAISTTVIGLASDAPYTLRDLWAHSQVKGERMLKVQLQPHAIAMYRIRQD